MKRLFIFLLAFTLIGVLGIGKAYAAECPQGYVKGESKLETMTISCGSTQIKQDSTTILSYGTPYILEASGTCNWRTSGSAGGYIADSEYWLRHDTYGEGWIKQDPGSVALWNGINPVNIDWGNYNEDHLYSYLYNPTTDDKITLYFYDDIYTDNSGNISVDIFQCNPLARSAEITAPDKDAYVSGDVNFSAFLIDDDKDPVQWAIRKGTCAMGTNTIWGNVDGKTDLATWIHDGLFTTKFSFTTNVNSLEEGMYCFIFNPTEDSGESEIRLVREFYIETDADNDGILDVNDICKGTKTDILSETLGVNRHFWSSKYHPYFETLVPKPKGLKLSEASQFSINDTKGCSCTQILDLLKGAGLGEFGGHYKFGCSKSVMQDFILDIKDGTIDGKYLIETVTIPANKTTVTLSNEPLMSGTNYLLLARGTANAGDGITFDARYSIRTGSSTVWTDAVSTYEGNGVTLLDLFFNGTTPWGNYNPSHEYKYMTVGDGNKASFLINDIYPSNNTGNLYVDIYGVL